MRRINIRSGIPTVPPVPLLVARRPRPNKPSSTTASIGGTKQGTLCLRGKNHVSFYVFGSLEFSNTISMDPSPSRKRVPPVVAHPASPPSVLVVRRGLRGCTFQPSREMTPDQRCETQRSANPDPLLSAEGSHLCSPFKYGSPTPSLVFPPLAVQPMNAYFPP